MAMISKSFKRFAAKECQGSSLLYEQLSYEIADDGELLELASYAQSGQPVPNLFMGAIHYLLLQGDHHHLQTFYSSIVREAAEVSGAFPFFKDFCKQNRQNIIDLLQSRLVQTNEVRRCAYLYPSFCYIYERAQQPLALIEIGTSAGLQLLWDHYAYTYSTGATYGRPESEMLIRSELRGAHTPILPKQSPPVHVRIGIDLHVSDMRESMDYLWLKALIWPEHIERRRMFEQAVRCSHRHAVQLIEGNGVTLLPKIASVIPKDTALCIFHTHVANQLLEAEKEELMQHVRQIGATRDVFHLYNNMWDSNLHLDSIIRGKSTSETLAEVDGHGRWFRWLR
jgi:hypothetical protein